MMYTPPLAYCGFLWWLSSEPRALPAGSSDKLLHVVAYAVLGGLWMRALWFTTSWPWTRALASAFLLALGYGIIDELHQSFVPGRDASAADAAADALGSLLGALLAAAFYVGSQRMARSLGARTHSPNSRNL